MCDREAEAVKEGVSKFSVCACMYDMGCLCPQRESLSVYPFRWILKTSYRFSIRSFLYPNSFPLYCFCLFF